jgi:hypothetical protein
VIATGAVTTMYTLRQSPKENVGELRLSEGLYSSVVEYGAQSYPAVDAEYRIETSVSSNRTSTVF